MRDDHVFLSYPLGGRYPTPEEIERLHRAARRMRSEAMHASLIRAVAWVRGLFRKRAARAPVRARAATC